jgi:hypothetical protein
MLGKLPTGQRAGHCLSVAGLVQVSVPLTKLILHLVLTSHAPLSAMHP